MPPAVGPHDAILAINQALEESLGSKRYQHWFGTSTRLELHETELVVHVQSPYLVKWIQRQFESQLLELAARHAGPEVTIRYEIGSDVILTPVPSSVTEEAPPQPGVSRMTSAAQNGTHKNRTKRSYTLSDFVVGPCNELAVAAAREVIEDPGCRTSLYLQGGIGNGKTHLLEAIRGRLRKEQPQLQTALLTSEQFGNYFSQALGAKTLPSFRQRFRNVDVLLVDDVDFFDGKQGFQDEFLHTVKQFEQAGRQIVVTANRHPRLLSRTCEELVSRYLSGLVCRIEAPDEQTRLEIVKRHAARQRTQFAPTALSHIASRFTSNVRELEGAVNLLGTWGNMTKKTVTVAAARQLLGRLERDCMRVVRLADVEQAVCELFGVDKEEMKSKSRKKTVAQPRMLAMYLARRLTETPYSEIGEYFGGRNHGTVISAVKKIGEQLEANGTLRIAAETWTFEEIVETLQERIRAS
jgi:chromosomal replication initiator protein